MPPNPRLLFIVYFAFLANVFGVPTKVNDPDDLTQFVNLFIGTTNDGHVFSGRSPILERKEKFLLKNIVLGATVPHGMIKAGLDTDSPSNVILFYNSTRPLNLIDNPASRL